MTPRPDDGGKPILLVIAGPTGAVRMFYVGTVDPTINAARVAARVMQGGHTVPIEKIISRYEGSLANLQETARWVDRLYLYDNSVDDVPAQRCARVVDGHVRKVYRALPAWIADLVDNLPPHPELIDLRKA